jgi:hypothetical protein
MGLWPVGSTLLLESSLGSLWLTGEQHAIPTSFGHAPGAPAARVLGKIENGDEMRSGGNTVEAIAASHCSSLAVLLLPVYAHEQEEPLWHERGGGRGGHPGERWACTPALYLQDGLQCSTCPANVLQSAGREAATICMSLLDSPVPQTCNLCLSSVLVSTPEPALSTCMLTMTAM